MRLDKYLLMHEISNFIFCSLRDYTLGAKIEPSIEELEFGEYRDKCERAGIDPYDLIERIEFSCKRLNPNSTRETLFQALGYIMGETNRKAFVEVANGKR